MKIDLIYPKIPENSDKVLNKCYAFEKLDGTNMHWVWTLVDGWHLFGTRRTQFPFTKDGIVEFTKTHPELTNAPQIFNDKFRDKMTAFFSRTKTWCLKKVILFTEFYGPNSFAGSHNEEDARQNLQTLTIIDLSLGGEFFAPDQLVEDVGEQGGFDIAKLIYTGKYNGQFIKDVRNGKYPVKEGVVIKGTIGNDLFMTKVKTSAYLKRLEGK